MKFSLDAFTVALLLVSSTAPSFALPQPEIESELVTRDNDATLEAIIDARTSEFYSELAEVKDLWKRKGGGGGGGRGGGSSSSGSSSSGSSSSGSSSSGSSSGGSSSRSGSRSGAGSSSSSSGGSTRQGSGVRPAYGGGRYYGGGATTPYRSGGRSPLGIAPVFLGVGALAIFPGLWLYGAYNYPYHNPYTYRNQSARRNSTNNSTNTNDKKRDLFALILRQASEGVNETKPVNCLCAEYAVCGCDDDGSTTFLDSVIGTGDYFQLNKSVINVVDINGTSTIVLNGTLPNGTTASGGTEDANAAIRNMAQFGGYWVMVALVGCTVMFV